MVGIRDFARRGQHEALLKWAMDIGFSPGSAADDLVRDLARVSQCSKISIFYTSGVGIFA